METLSDIKKGDTVYFGRSFGEKTLGEVVKVNRVKVKVKQLESRGTFKSHPVGTIWTVPVSLLSKHDGTPPRMPVENHLHEDTAGALQQLLGNVAKRPEAEILVEIRRIYAGLSPENLHCDGEISRSAAARRGAALNKRLRECFKELGRTVSEGEAFGY
jgi:hypothetical protein